MRASVCGVIPPGRLLNESPGGNLSIQRIEWLVLEQLTLERPRDVAVCSRLGQERRRFDARVDSPVFLTSFSLLATVSSWKLNYRISSAIYSTYWRDEHCEETNGAVSHHRHKARHVSIQLPILPQDNSTLQTAKGHLQSCMRRPINLSYLSCPA